MGGTRNSAKAGTASKAVLHPVVFVAYSLSIAWTTGVWNFRNRDGSILVDSSGFNHALQVAYSDHYYSADGARIRH